MLPALRAQRHPVQTAPFEALRWEQDRAYCLVDGNWYELIALDDVPSLELLRFCEETWPGTGQKRFGEDLVEAWVRMGRPDDPKTMDLTVRDPATREVRRLAGVALTSKKRQSVWRFNNGSQPCFT